MIIPHFFDDLTGQPLNEPALHRVVVVGDRDRQSDREFHLSALSLHFVMNPCFLGIGEVLKLLREHKYLGNSELLFSSRMLSNTETLIARSYEVTAHWTHAMSKEHFESYEAYLATLKDHFPKTALTAGRSGNNISLQLSYDLT